MITDFAVIDIETIPCQSLPDSCRPVFNEDSVKLGNLKDRFKIEEKINEAKSAWEMGLDKKMSLNPDLLQIVCFVGLRMPEKSFWVKFARSEDEEYDMLHDAWDFVRTCHNKGVPIVGFNSDGFDFPALIRRSMFQDVSVAPDMLHNLMKRQDFPNPNPHHIDLMKRLAFRDLFSGKLEVHGLDWHLKRFGLGGKLEGMNGSMVYPAWKEGRFDDIITYCRDGDVAGTAALFERVAPWIVPPKSPDRKMKLENIEPVSEAKEMKEAVNG